MLFNISVVVKLNIGLEGWVCSSFATTLMIMPSLALINNEYNLALVSEVSKIENGCKNASESVLFVLRNPSKEGMYYITASGFNSPQ